MVMPTGTQIEHLEWEQQENDRLPAVGMAIYATNARRKRLTPSPIRCAPAARVARLVFDSGLVGTRKAPRDAA